MTLKLTPEVLRGAYTYLTETEPFCKWNLPDPEEMFFKVDRHQSRYGCAVGDEKGHHMICVSSVFVGQTLSLMETVAHEMVHIHQAQAKMTMDHGLAFRKFAAHVCKVHGFDPKLF